MALFNPSAARQARQHNRHSIGLKGVRNSRELGGYRTADGRTIRRGKLLRTAQLEKATPADLRRLSEHYHLNTICDLRIPTERLRAPDPRIDGVEHISLSPLGIGIPTLDIHSKESTQALVHALKTGIVDAYMTNMYRMLVTEKTAIDAYHEMFVELLGADGKTFLWHCVDGKDRTGVAAALILSALGADREVIMADYLNSNRYNAKRVTETYKKVLDATHSVKLATDASTHPSVQKDWINHALDTIDREYGSMDRFLREQMGLTSEKTAFLREAYLK